MGPLFLGLAANHFFGLDELLISITVLIPAHRHEDWNVASRPYLSSGLPARFVHRAAWDRDQSDL